MQLTHGSLSSFYGIDVTPKTGTVLVPAENGVLVLGGLHKIITNFAHTVVKSPLFFYFMSSALQTMKVVMNAKIHSSPGSGKE